MITLDEYMLMNKISTSEVADKLGVSYFTVAHWRQGKNKPSRQNAKRLAKHYQEFQWGIK